jgi:hypothetical protein
VRVESSSGASSKRIPIFQARLMRSRDHSCGNWSMRTLLPRLRTTINQQSFVKAIVKYVLTANNPLAIVNDFEREKKIFLNYWKAITTLLDDGNSTTLYKYNGVELFCKFSIPFFVKLQDRGNFTVQTMEKLLRSCLDNVEGDYAGVGHPDFWAKGGKASFLNAGAINVISQEMAKALHKASMSSALIEV